MILDSYKDRLDKGEFIELRGEGTFVIISKNKLGYRFVSCQTREIIPRVNFIAVAEEWEDFKNSVMSKIVASALDNI